MKCKTAVVVMIPVLLVALAEGPSRAGQERGKKGMDVVRDSPRMAEVSPCGDVDQGGPSTGAKSLFYDRSSGVAITTRKSDPRSPGQRKRRPPTAEKVQPGGAASEVVGNTGLRYWIELVQPDGQMTRVARNRTFRSGEKIRLHFESNVDGYLAMVLTDSAGMTRTLFPTQKVRNGNNAIERGKDYVLPSDDAWFRFDENPGREHLTVLFSTSRDVIDQLRLEPEMDSRSTARVMSMAREGSKGLVVEVDDTAGEAQPAAYFVRRTSALTSYVTMEICLNHAR